MDRAVFAHFPLGPLCACVAGTCSLCSGLRARRSVARVHPPRVGGDKTNGRMEEMLVDFICLR